MAVPRFRLNVPDTGYYEIGDLPESGLVLQRDILTLNGCRRRRVIPVSPSTWRRAQERGEAPPTIFMFGQPAHHAEHIRAVALGHDWRKVTLQPDVVAAE
jgi:hypothetical protein